MVQAKERGQSLICLFIPKLILVLIIDNVLLVQRDFRHILGRVTRIAADPKFKQLYLGLARLRVVKLLDIAR